MDGDTRSMELMATQAQFKALCARWSLKPFEEVRLLGDRQIGEVEDGMRLLIELDRVMRALFGEDGVRGWLHDEGPKGLTPLEFLSLGPDEWRSMLCAARLRHRQTLGFDA